VFKRLWTRRWVRRGTIALLLTILAINLSVRFFGKSPAFPLSPFHLLDKSRALVALARHSANGVLQPSEREIKILLRQTAGQHRLPASLALAVADVESGFAPVRISPSGAMGLMQLMPGTAADLEVGDPYDARQNIRGGVRYLARLWSRYRSDISRVAAAYNAGPANVPTAGPFRMKSETSAYVAKVRQRSAYYRSLDSKRSSRKAR
jgi:soluble lytic murein transglycosylase-like protein